MGVAWSRSKFALLLVLLTGFGGVVSLIGAPSFRVATFNLENYLLEPVGTRPVKTAAARALQVLPARALQALPPVARARQWTSEDR